MILFSGSKYWISSVEPSNKTRSLMPPHIPNRNSRHVLSIQEIAVYFYSRKRFNQIKNPKSSIKSTNWRGSAPRRPASARCCCCPTRPARAVWRSARRHTSVCWSRCFRRRSRRRRERASTESDRPGPFPSLSLSFLLFLSLYTCNFHSHLGSLIKGNEWLKMFSSTKVFISYYEH